MLAVALYQPQIPPNTGNIMRLCANAGAELHLIEPLGFALEDRRLRRAGLGYLDLARVRVHPDYASFRAAARGRVLAFSTRARRCYSEVSYRADDALLFGPESSGLPEELLAGLPVQQRLRLPQCPGVRSLNLSNAVAVATFEAWRQLGFAGSA